MSIRVGDAARVSDQFPESALPGDSLPAGIDGSVPHSARIWNYWLGGHDNYPVDRQAGDEFIGVYPGIVDVARGVRQFLARVVRYLAGDAGVTQFLDIGAGLPTVDNTHEVAQQVNPACRVVYVDNDPLVLGHARALLASTPEGACEYLHADARDPGPILAAAVSTLDFTRPVALMMLGIMGHVGDYALARSVVGELMAALPAGSYLVLSDGANTSQAREEAHRRYAGTGALPYGLRSPEQIEGFFDGLELLEPGVVPVTRWRPGPGGPAPHVDTFGGVARKK
jgi:hypothetical protein